MEREVSTATELAAGLIMLAACLGIIIFTVFLGKSFGYSSLETMTDIEISVGSAQLSSVGEDAFLLPKAAAYSILTQNRRGVKSVSYNGVKEPADNPTGNIAKNLRGKVTMQVSRVAQGYYDIVIIDIPD